MTECKTVVQATRFFHSCPFPQFHCSQSLLKVLRLTHAAAFQCDHSYLHVVAYKETMRKGLLFQIHGDKCEIRKLLDSVKSPPSPLQSREQNFLEKNMVL